jgi:hypothetical protein
MRKAILIFLLGSSLRAEDRFLDWMNQIAQQQLDKREAAVRAVQSVDQAEARKRWVRAKILELIGGLPDYDGPLNARVTGRIEKNRYVIEKVIFESLPQSFVTANLYRPRAQGKYPAVLFPLGHWEMGKVAEEQTAANLALKGFVVLAYDPVGQGERQQAAVLTTTAIRRAKSASAMPACPTPEAVRRRRRSWVRSRRRGSRTGSAVPPRRGRSGAIRRERSTTGPIRIICRRA